MPVSFTWAECWFSVQTRYTELCACQIWWRLVKENPVKITTEPWRVFPRISWWPGTGQGITFQSPFPKLTEAVPRKTAKSFNWSAPPPPHTIKQKKIFCLQHGVQEKGWWNRTDETECFICRARNSVELIFSTRIFQGPGSGLAFWICWKMPLFYLFILFYSFIFLSKRTKGLLEAQDPITASSWTHLFLLKEVTQPIIYKQ